MTKFKVISSNPNQKGGFVTKITNEKTVNTVFGDKTKRTTYYVSGTKQLELNSEIEIDLNVFEVKVYPYVPDTSTGEVIDCKWLHLK